MNHPVERELLHSLRQAPVGYGLFDPSERLRDANEAFLTCFDVRLEGAPTWESLMRECHRRRRGVLIETDDIDGWIERVRRMHRREPVRQFESDLVDGRWMWVTETTRPDGWVLSQLIDVSHLKAHEATLRRARDEALLASLTDPLTHLYNRRMVFERLGDLIVSARQMRLPLCVAMVDLDHFKRINDGHGHGVGDAVLTHFAQLLRRELRPLDLPGRMGGEEFVLVLPNAALEGAWRAVDRLRRLVEDSVPLGSRLPALRYSFSAGITEAVEGDTPDHLISRADTALYEAKTQGRNRVLPRPGPPPPAAAG